MNKPVTLKDAEFCERAEYAIQPLDPMSILTPRGLISVVEVPGVMALQMAHDDGTSNPAVLVYDPQIGGLLAQMTPELARRLGASLINLANTLGAGAVS